MQFTGEPTIMIASLVKMLFSCPHRNLAFPITVKHDPRVPGSRYGKRTYVSCLDCGTELPYSWDQMRIEGADPTVAASLFRWVTSWFEFVRVRLSKFEFVRALFSKSVKLYIWRRSTRSEARNERTWRIPNGPSSETATSQESTTSAKIWTTLAEIVPPSHLPPPVTHDNSSLPYQSHWRALTSHGRTGREVVRNSPNV